MDSYETGYAIITAVVYIGVLFLLALLTQYVFSVFNQEVTLLQALAVFVFLKLLLTSAFIKGEVS